MKVMKQLFVSLSIISFLFPLSSCNQETKNSESLTITLNNPSDLDFHTDLQKQYLNDHYENILKYANGTQEKSRPNALVLSWDTNISEPIKEYNVYLSEKQNLDDAKLYTTSDNTLDIYNLKVATTYYWKVSIVSKNNDIIGESYIESFTTTSSQPRNMYVDGITNVRDLGGWNTSSNKKVKQGLLYRTARLNESNTDNVVTMITEKGKKTMLEEMKVKNEIDLRVSYNNENGNITESVLGNQVNYHLLPIQLYDANRLINDSDTIKKIFEILADKNNYPLFFHCSIGTDRTGLIALLINGLLGVSLEDLYRDYLFSNFGEIGSSRSITNINSYIHTISSYQKNTFQEKLEACLVDIGIPQVHLQAVKNILLED